MDDGRTTAPPPKRRSGALRMLVSLVVLGVVFVLVLPNIVDYGDVLDAIRSLSATAVTVLTVMTLGKWVAEGAIYAAVLPALGIRRGAVSYLCSSAVVNTVPGPMDLAVRYGMYRTWGFPNDQATAAVVAGGLFSTTAKLVLPSVAVVVTSITTYRQDGLGMYAVIGTLVAVAAIAFVVLLFRSEGQARALGDFAGRVASRVLVRFHRPPVEGVGDRFAAIVVQSSTVVRSRWPLSVAATTAATLLNYALLLVSLRVSGVPDEALPWQAVFVSFATVQFLTVVPITSGNVGVSELVYIGTMGSVAGAAYRAEVVAGVLVYRVFTWLLVIPIGWLTLVVWQGLQRRQGKPVDVLSADAEVPV